MLTASTPSAMTFDKSSFVTERAAAVQSACATAEHASMKPEPF